MRFLLSLLFICTSSPSFAEFLNSEAEVDAYFEDAVFREFSDKRGEEILETFAKGKWVQLTMQGKKIWSGRIKIKKDGRVCAAAWNNKCARVDVNANGFQFVLKSGKRGDQITKVK